MGENDTAEIREAAKNVVDNLLPEKSASVYKQCYAQFVEWQRQQNTRSVSEDVMLVYFKKLSTELKPSTLWSKYSMLRSTVQNFHNVDMSRYKRLSTFLAKISKGYAPIKSKTLEPQHVEKFLCEAPDDRYLCIKAALIFGIAGACRREELKHIKIQDIEHHEKLMLVRIPHTKNDIPRKFTIEGEFYEVIKKYEALHPKDVTTDEFFLTLRNGKCTKQVVGINTFGAMPKVIAEYLGLDEPGRFTGHSFRRTSATMLADAGVDLLTLKRHGGWKSDSVAQGYVAESMCSKRKICKQICSSVQLNRGKSAASATTSRPVDEEIGIETAVDSAGQGHEGESMSIVTTVDSVASEASETHVSNKENLSVVSNSAQKKKVAIELKHCNVTFNFAKD